MDILSPCWQSSEAGGAWASFPIVYFISIQGAMKQENELEILTENILD